MTVFDTHFHLDQSDDLESLATRAGAAGVGAMMLVAGTAVGATAEMAAVAPRWQGPTPARPLVYAAVGVHPHEAKSFDGDLGPYREWAAAPWVKAIGEIGLDYYYGHSPADAQQRVFRQFLQLAVETRLPAVIHCRDAYDDCLALLKQLPAGHPFVIHCYSGTVEWAQRFLALGGCLSYTGLITFPKGDNVRAALRATPVDRVFFETDSPFLAPVPYRGQRNEPAFVVKTIERAAIEYRLAVDDLARLSTANAKAFFKIAEEL